MKYRKKPIEVEAIQFTGQNQQEILDFVGLDIDYIEGERRGYQTMEINRGTQGSILIEQGEYLVKGKYGGFTVQNREVFEQKYEEENREFLEISIPTTIAQNLLDHPERYKDSMHIEIVNKLTQFFKENPDGTE